MIRYFATHKGKVFLNVFISCGAVVVILGALGKILHATWGTMAITLGMSIECVIFLLMALVPVDHHPHWDRYFPDLYKDPHDELKEGSDLGFQKTNFLEGGNVGGSSSGNVALDHLDDMLAKADINPKNLKKLSENFEKFNVMVSKIVDVGNGMTETTNFANKAREASEALDILKKTYLASAEEISSTNFGEGMKSFYEQMYGLTKNVSSLNSIYGVEIQDTLNEIKKVKGYFSNLNHVANELNGTILEVQQTKEQISILVNNLSNLNDVYGRVLTAMQGR